MKIPILPPPHHYVICVSFLDIAVRRLTFPQIRTMPLSSVAADLCKQIEAGQSGIIGLMIESNLVEGRQVPVSSHHYRLFFFL